MKEYRPFTDTELRFDNTGNTPKFVGYAAVFDVLSREQTGHIRERIHRGAFAEALETNEVRATLDHKTELTLGKKSSGTLRLKEDSKGLKFEIDVPKTSYAEDLMELVTRKDVNGCSFGFYVDPVKYWTSKTRGEYSQRGETRIREYSAIDLFDVSIVYEPTWLQTEVSIRSFDEYFDYLKSLKTRIIKHKLQWLKSQKGYL